MPATVFEHFQHGGCWANHITQERSLSFQGVAFLKGFAIGRKNRAFAAHRLTNPVGAPRWWSR